VGETQEEAKQESVTTAKAILVEIIDELDHIADAVDLCGMEKLHKQMECLCERLSSVRRLLDTEQWEET